MSYNLKQEVMLMIRWKLQSYQNLLIATEYVWAKSLVKEQSDLTKRGMDQWGQDRHTTALFNSSLVGQWMHLSSRPPAADWMGQNSVCHGVTLPFPESCTWNPSLLFSGQVDKAVIVSRTSFYWPPGFYWPLSHWEVHDHQSVQWVALRAAILQFCRSGDLTCTSHFILRVQSSCVYCSVVTIWIPV